MNPRRSPQEFVGARRDRWERIEVFTQRARNHGIRSLTGPELLEFGRLYRATTGDLALARRDFPADRVTDYLNSLIAAAYPFVYAGDEEDDRGLLWWVRFGFPATYRSAGRYIAVAFGLFALSAVVAAVLVALHPAMADVLLPGTAQSLRSVMEQHRLWMYNPSENDAVTANFIMINNIKVAFIAFAGGVLAGTLTIFVLLQNGIMFGAVAAMVAQYGLSRPFWAFVIPHGVVELSVIFMAGGCGLMIGDALLRPGLHRRRDALSQATRRTAVLLLGCVPLLMLAGTIEGFLSPSGAPMPVKVAVGVITGTALYGYLLLSRERVGAEAPGYSSVRALISR